MESGSSVSNTGTGAAVGLRSVSNQSATESEAAAAAPAELEKIGGSPGAPSTGEGLSAADLIVRGTAPFKRARPDVGVFESLIGPDERVRILDTDQAPWRMICSLEIRAAGRGVWVGTGWFAGPKTLITAGHCVHHDDMGGWATEIIVRPGRSGAKEPFAALSSKRFDTTDRWFNDRNPDFDYAAIHLDDDALAVSAVTGWFNTVVLNDAGLAAQRVNVSGYPGDKGNGMEQWFHAKQVLRTTARRVYYDVDTMGGQSGAPVWLDTDEGPKVVGIHAYGVGATLPGVTANSAPRITAEVLQRIRGWVGP